MKLVNTLLSFAVVSSARIIPDGELTDQIILQSQKDFKGLSDRAQGNVEDICPELKRASRMPLLSPRMP